MQDHTLVGLKNWIPSLQHYSWAAGRTAPSHELVDNQAFNDERNSPLPTHSFPCFPPFLCFPWRSSRPTFRLRGPTGSTSGTRAAQQAPSDGPAGKQMVLLFCLGTHQMGSMQIFRKQCTPSLSFSRPEELPVVLPFF